MPEKTDVRDNPVLRFIALIAAAAMLGMAFLFMFLPRVI
jgi:hypothetical protein